MNEFHRSREIFKVFFFYFLVYFVYFVCSSQCMPFEHNLNERRFVFSIKNIFGFMHASASNIVDWMVGWPDETKNGHTRTTVSFQRSIFVLANRGLK